MEKIISREGGKQLRHTYEEVTPEKRPQDVRYEGKLGGPVLSRRDGAGVTFTALEQHGLDTCPEIIVVRDHFRRRLIKSKSATAPPHSARKPKTLRDVTCVTRRWNTARMMTCPKLFA
jgi:hypothetical protein